MLNGFMMAAAGASVPEVAFTDSDFDTSALSSVTFSAMSFGSAATDRRMILCITYRAVGGRTISGVTIGGQTATRLVAVLTEGVSRNSLIYIADVPSGTTGDVVITANSALNDVGVSIYRTVGLSTTTTPNDTGTDNAQTANLMDVSLNTLANSVVVACCASENNVTTTWAGVTEGADFSVGTRSHSSGAIVALTAETPRTVTATYSSTPNNETAASICIQ